MKAKYIDYKETCSFSPAVIRYLEKDQQLQSFISQFPDHEGFRRVISERNVLADRGILTDVLKDQYSQTGSPIPDALQQNIGLLGLKNTFTVTTGHQLNVFTGPLYFIYKIVTAIKLAKELKTEFPDKNFVPVYWMATEDHDFAEINHTHIRGKKIIWEEQATGATGRLNPKGMLEALKEYKAILGVDAHSAELASLVNKAYTSQSTLAGATRYLVNELFGHYGLVIVDGDDPRSKRQFAAFIEEDILNLNSYRAIEASVKQLEQAGIPSQVNPREINFFYLKDNLRERIVLQNERYYVLNTDLSFNREQLHEEISRFPERFSPNVVMRPLYQEVILPNIAYIGGGAEVIYWLELKGTFDHYGVDFPILMLRNSALAAAESLQTRLANTGVKLTSFFKDPEAIKKEWVLEHSDKDLHVNQEWQELEAVFEKLKSKAGEIDRTLQPSTEAIQARLKTALWNLEKKFLRAEKRNHETSLKQILTLKEKYFPNGSLQERSENFGTFYSRYGRQFIDGLIEAFQPLEFKFTIIEFEEKN